MRLRLKSTINSCIGGRKLEFPSVFYVGLSKTASSSALFGFPDNFTAHWHHFKYFKKLHPDLCLNCQINPALSEHQYNLYDFIFSNCSKHKIKPLIIEHIRDPIARALSIEFQFNKKLTYDKAMDLFNSHYFLNNLDQRHDYELYSHNLIPKYLDKLKKYQENEHGKFVILKFETDLQDRESFFKSIGYNFKNKHSNNKTNNIHYQKVLKNFKVKEDILIKIYKNNKGVQAFYSDDEINNFITRWKE